MTLLPFNKQLVFRAGKVLVIILDPFTTVVVTMSGCFKERT